MLRRVQQLVPTRPVTIASATSATKNLVPIQTSLRADALLNTPRLNKVCSLSSSLTSWLTLWCDPGQGAAFSREERINHLGNIWPRRFPSIRRESAFSDTRQDLSIPRT
ncbi:hypothetical protein AG1IA_01314 [Rhizoctonia solani AG-1 IA]|uniref:Uncharacterized protein n=1 Tax=Thanatephorus cucumeris (strain AG1-IA) TaxID=983506 RepID=L8X6L0_THACA|nr:hypothetical protein AG1IA_01314 [Rhizoctonia solani AG-1 IA]